MNKLRLEIVKGLFLHSAIKDLKGYVLDAGCGDGRFLEMYQNAIGIDNDFINLVECKGKGLKCKYGDVMQIPFPDNTFDGIVCSHVLEHTYNFGRAVEEFARVLKDGGKLVILLPSGEAGFRHSADHKTFIKEDMLVPALKSNGFKVDKIAYFPFKYLRDYFYFFDFRVIATLKK
jgi:ubiquinone/menaquinone biosynthesis C-methylase UbiE